MSTVCTHVQKHNYTAGLNMVVGLVQYPYTYIGFQLCIQPNSNMMITSVSLAQHQKQRAVSAQGVSWGASIHRSNIVLKSHIV